MEPIVEEIQDVTSELLKATSSDTITKIINTNGYGSIEKLSDAILMIGLLAGEIKELKRIVTTQGLLIKHEEEVRLTKATRTPAKKNVIPKFKPGDLVVRIKGLDKPNAEPLVGTIKKTNGDRAFVRFEGEEDVWVAKRSIVHWKLAA